MSQEITGMLQHMLGASPGHSRLQPPSANDPLQTIFKQLAQSLTMLSSTTDAILVSRPSGPTTPNMFTWLPQNARQAEDAMHRLRELRLPAAAMSELSQCMTILILAADMLCAGPLSEEDAHQCYDLLRRNANRAVVGLYELHNQLGDKPAR